MVRERPRPCLMPHAGCGCLQHALDAKPPRLCKSRGPFPREPPLPNPCPPVPLVHAGEAARAWRRVVVRLAAPHVAPAGADPGPSHVSPHFLCTPWPCTRKHAVGAQLPGGLACGGRPALCAQLGPLLRPRHPPPAGRALQAGPGPHRPRAAPRVRRLAARRLAVRVWRDGQQLGERAARGAGAPRAQRRLLPHHVALPSRAVQASLGTCGQRLHRRLPT